MILREYRYRNYSLVWYKDNDVYLYYRYKKIKRRLCKNKFEAKKTWNKFVRKLNGKHDVMILDEKM